MFNGSDNWKKVMALAPSLIMIGDPVEDWLLKFIRNSVVRGLGGGGEG